MNLLQFLSSIEIGLIYSLVAFGVYISFRIIDFPDLTADGSFTCGAAISAVMITQGFHPSLAILLSLVVGSLAGFVTGYLNVKFKILGLLASILTMTALYSINLRIMDKPNIAIIEQNTIFTDRSVLVVLLIITLLVILILGRFFVTEFGLSIRAVGINIKLCSAYGINANRMKIIALSLSNALIALSGSIFTQSQGFADISMGTGTIIVGLASIIIGETIISARKIHLAFWACLIGSILYRLIIGFALNADHIGFEAADLNLITSVLVAGTMIINRLSRKGDIE